MPSSLFLLNSIFVVWELNPVSVDLHLAARPLSYCPPHVFLSLCEFENILQFRSHREEGRKGHSGWISDGLDDLLLLLRVKSRPLKWQLSVGEITCLDLWRHQRVFVDKALIEMSWWWFKENFFQLASTLESLGSRCAKLATAPPFHCPSVIDLTRSHVASESILISARNKNKSNLIFDFVVKPLY